MVERMYFLTKNSQWGFIINHVTGSNPYLLACASILRFSLANCLRLSFSVSRSIFLSFLFTTSLTPLSNILFQSSHISFNTATIVPYSKQLWLLHLNAYNTASYTILSNSFSSNPTT